MLCLNDGYVLWPRLRSAEKKPAPRTIVHDAGALVGWSQANVPYLVLTLLEFCTIALFMNVFFGVPIHGSFAALWMLTLPFVLTCWASAVISTG